VDLAHVSVCTNAANPFLFAVFNTAEAILVLQCIERVEALLARKLVLDLAAAADIPAVLLLA
jgi:predicted nicotinamide N-methyase